MTVKAVNLFSALSIAILCLHNEYLHYSSMIALSLCLCVSMCPYVWGLRVGVHVSALHVAK